MDEMHVDTVGDARECAIIIPAYNPPERLVTYVEELHDAGFESILVIDDGSKAECQPVFDAVRAGGLARVFVHAVNLGKGRSLKDGFNLYLAEMAGEGCPCGAITVDCDGQHLVEDVVRLNDEMVNGSNDSLYLGVRDFSAPGVPKKSRWGNNCTRLTVKLLYGGNISDIMTGMRGLPRLVIPKFIELFGERFEYEPNMLIQALSRDIPIVQMPITTVYFNNNEETTFNPIRDSWKIYKLIFGTFFKFLLSSLSSYIVDILCFALINAILAPFGLVSRVWIATIGARIISSLFNFTLNRNVVFSRNEPKKGSLWKYYVLVVAQMCCSAALVSAVCVLTGMQEVIAKIIVDTVLFFVSYQIQRLWVFKSAD